MHVILKTPTTRLKNYIKLNRDIINHSYLLIKLIIYLQENFNHGN